VDAEPVKHCDRWHLLVRCRSVTYGGHTRPAAGRLYVTAGDGLGQLEPGDSVLVYGLLEAPSPARNPGGFSQACWLARRGVFTTLSTKPGGVVSLGFVAWDWRRWAERLRHQIAAANRTVMGDAEAADLVNSMLFGDSDAEEGRSWGSVEERFRRAGVSHVLVVSGAQAALLFGLLAAWRRWVLLPRREARPHWRLLRVTGGYSLRQALGGGLVLLALYVPLVGLQPSILRPALVVTIFSIGRWLDREVDPENSLAAAALFLLVLNPLTLYDLGFQHSFAAVWSILRWTPPLASLLCRRGPPREDDIPDSWGTHFPTVTRRASLFASVTAMTLAAQLATTPLEARQSQLLSFVAPLSNVPAILMTIALLPIGLLSSTISAVGIATHLLPWPQFHAPWRLLHAISWPTQELARLLNFMVIWFAHPRAAAVPVAPPSWAELAVIGALLVVGSTPTVLKRRALSFSLLGLAALTLAIAITRPAAPVSVPTLTFIDVGQGDGCLIRLPGGYNLLVDGGGSPRAPCEQRDCSDAPVGHLADSIRKDCADVGRGTLAEFLRYERVRRIDLMVLTHPHDDHVWGMDALLDPRQGFDVHGVLDAGQPYESPANREWLTLLRQRRLAPINARRGMELTVGPARLVVLHPPPGAFLTHTRNDPNNNSIVLRMEVGGSRVLLTGDAEAEAEASMAGQDLEATVLKVGHHGSAYSTSDDWLERVRPRIAVISCGRHNSFGHPSPATLDRLRRHGVHVYRTDRDGAVTLELGSESWTAATMVHAEPAVPEHVTAPSDPTDSPRAGPAPQRLPGGPQ
jgi:competence protein ComEC